MATTSEDAWTAYHAAGGTWEAWLDARLAEERESILAIMTEVTAVLQRQLQQTVLEMRAASRPMDGRDGRSLKVRDTWDPGASYFALDVVACDGASFVARRDNPGPCPGDGWQLCAKQGPRGKLDVRTRTATPIYSDGRFGPALELGALFESAQDEGTT
jgi:hypothetical protein